ncbi:hypothetical protein JANET_152 [Bacillus phage Janet]|nr:hypothetical protein JANET_152 [Bacillus phage Janet]
MYSYAVTYYDEDLNEFNVTLDAKNLTMLEQIVHRIQYSKAKKIIITKIKWLGLKEH